MADPISLLAVATAASSGSVGLGGLTSLGSIATFGSYALLGGAAVGGVIALNALNKKPATGDQQTVKQSIPPRTRAYGRVLIGGAYFFFAADATTLVSGFALCEGPIAAFEVHWLGDTEVLAGFDAGTVGVWPWYGHIFISGQKGYPNQQYQQVIEQHFAGWWGATHKNCGIANSVVLFTLPDDPKDFGKFFPSGAPQYRVQMRASLVYDPRDPDQDWSDAATWTWSRNPALCILDYMTSPRGMGLPQSRFDLASFSAMADLCDQAVTLPVAEQRYLLDGTYTLDEAPKDVLARMLQTCDGELFPLATGTIGLRGGAWSEPEFDITPDMIISCDAKRGVDKLAAFNQLKIRYVEEAEEFQLIETTPYDDVAAQAAAGEVLPQDFTLPMVHHHGQAIRLAAIAMAKGNPDWLLEMTLSVAALQMLGARIVTVTFPDIGLAGDTFFVNAFAISEDGSTCTASLGSLTGDAYSYQGADNSGSTSSTKFGPIVQALMVGADMDWGLIADPPDQTDDFGSIADAPGIVIDMGSIAS